MRFPSTHWSLLARASLHGDASAQAALAEFFRRYRPPVVAFIRHRGASDPEDVAHDFFLHLLEKSTLRRADAERGRFRSFLLGSLVRFLHDARDRAAAAKRGGNVTLVALEDADEGGHLPGQPPSSEEDFDRAWAVTLLTLTIRALHDDFAARGRSEAFTVLRAYLPGGLQPPSYAEAAARLGQSVGACKVEIHRLRDRFRAQLRREVAATVDTPDEVEKEIAYLARVLQSGHRSD